MGGETPGDPRRDWKGYYRWISGREVRPLFTRALEYFGEVTPGSGAVDVGCGDGTETRALLDAGFTVTAIDSSEWSMEQVQRHPECGTTLMTVHTPMQDAQIPQADLVYAGFSLPFCPPEAFPVLWHRLATAVRPGGVLAADLFGVRDTWRDTPDMTFVTREYVSALVNGLELRSLHEIEEEGQSFVGPKHWHTFQLVLRKPVVG